MLQCCAVPTCSVVSDSLWLHGLKPSRLLCPWGFSKQLECVSLPSSRGSSNPEIKPRSPALQADSLPSEPPGKSKNTGVGSLSLHQGNLLTESNQCLLHCRRILHQLSYQGSPTESIGNAKDVSCLWPGIRQKSSLSLVVTLHLRY